MRTKNELYQQALRTVAMRRQTARALAQDAQRFQSYAQASGDRGGIDSSFRMGSHAGARRLDMGKPQGA